MHFRITSHHYPLAKTRAWALQKCTAVHVVTCNAVSPFLIASSNSSPNKLNLTKKLKPYIVLINQSTNQSINQRIDIDRSIIQLIDYQSTNPSSCLYVCPSVHPSVCQSVSQSVSSSIDSLSIKIHLINLFWTLKFDSSMPFT